MNVGLAITVFLACLVECVEALTIVLAVGTRSWRSALSGATAALIVLTLGAALLALLGANLPAPLWALRAAIGAILLTVGMQWLRKAILRSAGRKALHDEADTYAGEAKRAQTVAPFLLSFQGVLLEGVEVMVTVVAFGVGGKMVMASGAALCALATVCTLGVVVRAPLTRVPENAIKLMVGTMLTTYGLFWSAEGMSLPVSDPMLLGMIPLVLGASWGAVLMLRNGLNHKVCANRSNVEMQTLCSLQIEDCGFARNPQNPYKRTKSGLTSAR